MLIKFHQECILSLSSVSYCVPFRAGPGMVAGPHKYLGSMGPGRMVEMWRVVVIFFRSNSSRFLLCEACLGNGR